MPRREERARKLGVPADQLLDGRGKHGNHAKGSAHPRWNNDRMVSEHGYVKIRVGRTHPLADDNGYAYEHIVVAVAALGRFLGPDEVVHHRNHDPMDNRWENLKVLTDGEHRAIHTSERIRDERGRFT